MLTQSHDEDRIIARVADLDIGKTDVAYCVRSPPARGEEMTADTDVGLETVDRGVGAAA